MIRPAGLTPPAALWHVALGGAEAAPPWPKERDRFVFLALLRRWLPRAGAACEGFCLEARGVRLLVASPSAVNLRFVLAQACCAYSRYWHEWYPPRRRVFRPPRAVSVPASMRWDSLAGTEAWPVLAGICEHAWQYRWSSAASHAGLGISYLPLAMQEWSEAWNCALWRERLAAWPSDVRARKQLDSLLRRGVPLRALASPGAVPPPPPLFRPPAEAARAAAGF